jgi:hypothetical protein
LPDCVVFPIPVEPRVSPHFDESIDSDRTIDDGSLPARILEIAGSQSGLPATQVLLPDWKRISLSQMPGISRSGSIDGKPYSQLLGYELSRRWSAGMTPDQYLKLGDISQAFQAEVFLTGAVASILKH